VRKLLDQFPGSTTVGEIGDSHKGLQLMEEYTSGGDKLHMAYTFDMLGNEFTAEHFRSKMDRFFTTNKDGWPCWSFSNHDVDRHVSRWSKHSLDRTALAKQAAGMIIGLKGSVCIYQGEELGLPQADILFEELTDPPGIRFWPEYKGRDGERTPMPWDEGDAPNGFSSAKPWLPVKPEHSALSVAAQNADPDSVLNFYRLALAFRKGHSALIDGDIEFFKVSEPVLAFRRANKDESLVCIYNLSAETLKVKVEGDADIGLSQGIERLNGRLTLHANGWAIFTEHSDNPLRIEFKRRAKKPSN
jgi:alpha-glucosidase